MGPSNLTYLCKSWLFEQKLKSSSSSSSGSGGHDIQNNYKWLHFCLNSSCLLD